MARTSSRLPLVALAVLVLGLSAALAWRLTVSDEPDRRIELEAALAPADLGGVAAAPPAPVELTPPRDPNANGGDRTATALVETSVAWPVKVELELVRAANLPKAKDAPAMGSGATARLRGRLMVREGGVAGKLTFTGGANAGRMLPTNERGEFGAIDLYPGVAEVRIDAGGFESIREVRLRAGQQEELNISYDLPGQVWGEVFDRDGKGLEGVDVELDGRHAKTDETGVFHFGATAGGDAVQLILRKDGFATQCHRIAVAAGRVTERGRYAYTLLPAARLEISLGARVGSREDPVVILLPEVMGMSRSYPWHRVSPARVKPGATLKLDDLPSGRIAVRVFHGGAKANPESGIAFLEPGQTETYRVEFEPSPALVGFVADKDGRRIEGARVVCEAPDRTGATLQYLRGMPDLLESEIVPSFPVGASEARTDFNGEFALASYPEFGDVRYVWAESPDGKLWGARSVRSNDATVQIVVAPVDAGRSTVRLVFPGRNQGLPVVASLGGRPREEVILAADAPLELEGLAPGTWRLRASWNGRSLLRGGQMEFELSGEESIDLPLPEGAILGQDADTLLRAGRPVPARLLGAGR